MMPARCAASRTDAVCAPRAITSAAGIGPVRAIRRDSVSPSSSSMISQGDPSSRVPQS